MSDANSIDLADFRRGSLRGCRLSTILHGTNRRASRISLREMPPKRILSSGKTLASIDERRRAKPCLVMSSATCDHPAAFLTAMVGRAHYSGTLIVDSTPQGSTQA